MVDNIVQTFFDLCEQNNLGLSPTEDGSVIIFKDKTEMVMMFNDDDENQLRIEFYESEELPDANFKEFVLNLFSEAINTQPIK